MPEYPTRSGVQGVNQRTRTGDINHPIYHDRRGGNAVRDLKFRRPRESQAVYVGRIDLGEWRVVLALKVASFEKPVLAPFGFLQDPFLEALLLRATGRVLPACGGSLLARGVVCNARPQLNACRKYADWG